MTDRESAFEKLQARAGAKVEVVDGAPAATPGTSVPGSAKDSLFNKVIGGAESVLQPTIGPRGAVHDSVATSMMKSAMRAARVGRQVVRGILGGLFGGGGRR
mgnify:CR=1 FL=1